MTTLGWVKERTNSIPGVILRFGSGGQSKGDSRAHSATRGKGPWEQVKSQLL